MSGKGGSAESRLQPHALPHSNLLYHVSAGALTVMSVPACRHELQRHWLRCAAGTTYILSWGCANYGALKESSKHRKQIKSDTFRCGQLAEWFSWIRALGVLFQEHYPERMSRCFVINAPAFFNMLYR